jgi:F420-non-reducing hydrogenase iron-sulfur subunit
MAEKTFDPTIIGFLCNWCSYTAADSAGVSRMTMPSSVMIIRLMCTGRVDPLFVLTAFLRGADGVLVGGCWPGQCHYKEGNLHARRRSAVLQTIFETLDLDLGNRFRLSWVAASEAPRFVQVVREFHGHIREAGPSPIAEEMFL